MLRHALISGALLLAATAAGQVATGFGFSRIVSGWTNYSTAFNTTQDPGPEGEYATIACFYTPPVDVRPLEFSAVLIWFGSGGQRLDFSDFTFQVHIWSSLAAFINSPRRGDLAAVDYLAATGGSTTKPDAVTRGGRPAYLLHFSLTNAPLALAQCQTVLIGLSAQTEPARSGELYVPTAPFAGMSDVQGGNIVPFGWTYLIDAGGLTAYWGQLATELKVEPMGGVPRLAIERTGPAVQLTWPASAGCFALEASDDLRVPMNWSPVGDPPSFLNGVAHHGLGTSNRQRWFRLRREPASVFMP